MENDPDLTRLLGAYFEATPFSAVITRASDAVIVYANERARQALLQEFDLSDPIGTSVFEIGYFEDPSEDDEVVARSRLPDGYFRRDNYQVAGEQGAEITNTKALDFEGVEYLCTLSVDISEVLDAERALEDALDRLEKAQSLARLGDFVTDLDADEFNGSKEAMRILGLPEGVNTVSVRDLFRQFHPDDKRMVAGAMNAQLPNGSFLVEHRLDPDIDGERWVFTQGQVETLADGRAVVRGTVQDITARKIDERQRAQLNEKMQEAQKLESLGLLAGGIAHDFNNLLAGIMGNADFALLEQNLPAEVAARLEDIIAASRRAADLTRQLLAYSGKGKFVVEPVDLSKLIREMTELLNVSIAREHSLQLQLADDLPAVEVDTAQIQQVVMNLIINAGEAIEGKQGLISITTDVQHCDDAYLSSANLLAEMAPGDYVYFEISDNGAGMDSETIQRIFDPFFTTKFTGRGLGLAAALGIARGHRGGIKIYSEVGVGSTFKFFLPVSPLIAKVEELNSDQHADWRGTGTVLVIDDDESVRRLVAPVLRRYGYDVMAASDGMEGVQIFRNHADEIDLVLLDLTMPRLDGRAAFTQLKTLRPGIPVILMSGYNEQDATQRFVGKGLAGFLAKPFMVSTLLEMIKAQLPAD